MQLGVGARNWLELVLEVKGLRLELGWGLEAWGGRGIELWVGVLDRGLGLKLRLEIGGGLELGLGEG